MGVEASRQSAFVLSSPPLAALHNMTEMKMPPSAAAVASTAADYAKFALGGGNARASLAGLGTPHGIQDILSRPGMNFAQLGLPRLNTAAAMYFNGPAAAAAAAVSSGRFPKPVADLPGRSAVYWPGMLQGTAAWRSPGELAFSYLQHLQINLLDILSNL